jgi:hypothetical protein
MSKSMWCDAMECKPEKSERDPNKSIPVLFWLLFEEAPYWGTYNFFKEKWSYTDYNGYSHSFAAENVHYFAYIDNPYK